jgi:hypothetical protein
MLDRSTNRFGNKQFKRLPPFILIIVYAGIEATSPLWGLVPNTIQRKSL